MTAKSFFFAGGGTGGHIYPALAVAEKLVQLDGSAAVHFFCSNRPIDADILSKTGFRFTPLPATPPSLKPTALVRFFSTLFQSRKIAQDRLSASPGPVVIGVGGFVAAPVCWAAHAMRIPIALLNVDIVPGKANKLLARWAKRIFVQFDDTIDSFGRYKSAAVAFGCPLRTAFERPDPRRAREKLGLDKNKKILLITGASSGSASINNTVCSLLGKLADFADRWQIVHLTGRANFAAVTDRYAGAKIPHKVIDYYDDMPDLLAAADLVIGRSGAVSVAEYAAAGVPAICMPYPHHRDLHQYLNAGKLVDAGAAIIVDDLPDAADRSEWLWEELSNLLSDQLKRQQMRENCRLVAKKDAAAKIADALLQL